MKWNKLCLFPVALLVFLACSIASAQLPDPSVDIALGLRARQELLQDRYIVKGTPPARTATEVFGRMLNTSPVTLSGLPFTWNITVLSGEATNAYATAGGQVYVENGLAQILGERKALWGAVIGHELAHTARRHHVAAYVRATNLQLEYLKQKAYYERRRALGDESATWSLLGLEIGRIAGGLLSLKLSRDQEHDADRVGMMMMAEAGYHPAYIFVLQNTLKAYFGDRSKFRAFFSGHPRWETRGQRSHAVYTEAVARFESRWPNPRVSPGGTPPPIVSLGKPVTRRAKKDGVVVIRVPVQIEEGAGQELGAYALLLHKGRRIPSGVPEYRDLTGLFLAAQPMQASAKSHHVNCGLGLEKVYVFDSPRADVWTTANCGEKVTLLTTTRTSGGAEGGATRGVSLTKIRMTDGKEGYIADSLISEVEGKASSQLEFRLPTTALPSKQRKLKSQICVVTQDGLLLNCTKQFKVKFPKPRPQKNGT